MMSASEVVKSDSKIIIVPADGDDELLALSGPVDGGQWPSDTDAKEDVDGVGASDVTVHQFCDQEMEWIYFDL